VAFRLKIEDLFRIGEKTVFTGELDTQSKVISNADCIIEIDGERTEELHIEGEVRTGKPNRDLWTTSPISLTREIVQDHEVWLIAE
jgi:hypothetical protein